MTTPATIHSAVAEIGEIISHGELTEESPLRFRLPAERDGYRQARARMWVRGYDETTTLLRIEYPVRTFHEAELDVAEFERRVLALNSRFLFGTMARDCRIVNEHVEHEVTVTHTIPLHGLTAGALTTVMRGMLNTRSLCMRELRNLSVDRRKELRAERDAAAACPPNPLEELDALVGLTPVKALLRELADQQRVNQLRAEAGMKVATISPHLVFTGNPGTGKTTVAKLVGRMYHSLGLLSKGHVVEADRNALVAGYVGQTAIKTRALCEQALGGVLFIDEAYSLSVEGRDFGNEAVETLLTFMEEHRGDFVVVAAGYPADMHRFIASNPGLQSRFDRTVEFPDYSDYELFQIFTSLITEHDYLLNRHAIPRVRRLIASMPRGRGFGNAREIRRLFNEVVCKHASLIIGAGTTAPSRLRVIPPHAIPDPALPSTTAQATPDVAYAGYL